MLTQDNQLHDAEGENPRIQALHVPAHYIDVRDTVMIFAHKAGKHAPLRTNHILLPAIGDHFAVNTLTTTRVATWKQMLTTTETAAPKRPAITNARLEIL